MLEGRAAHDIDHEARRRATDGISDSNPATGKRQASRRDAQAQRGQAKRIDDPDVGAADRQRGVRDQTERGGYGQDRRSQQRAWRACDRPQRRQHDRARRRDRGKERRRRDYASQRSRSAGGARGADPGRRDRRGGRCGQADRQDLQRLGATRAPARPVRVARGAHARTRSDAPSALNPRVTPGIRYRQTPSRRWGTQSLSRSEIVAGQRGGPSLLGCARTS